MRESDNEGYKVQGARYIQGYMKDFIRWADEAATYSIPSTADSSTFPVFSRRKEEQSSTECVCMCTCTYMYNTYRCVVSIPAAKYPCPRENKHAKGSQACVTEVRQKASQKVGRPSLLGSSRLQECIRLVCIESIHAGLPIRVEPRSRILLGQPGRDGMRTRMRMRRRTVSSRGLEERMPYPTYVCTPMYYVRHTPITALYKY